MVTCPECNSSNIVKYGKIHNGKQRYRCHDCHRQFVPTATKKCISDEQKSLVDKLLLERLSLAAISRIAGISESWIQRYVNNKSIYTSESMGVEPSKKTSCSRSALSCNVMSCGHLWDLKRIRNGCG